MRRRLPYRTTATAMVAGRTAASSAGPAPDTRNLARHVEPLIGTSASGMIQWWPDTLPAGIGSGGGHDHVDGVRCDRPWPRHSDLGRGATGHVRLAASFGPDAPAGCGGPR